MKKISLGNDNPTITVEVYRHAEALTRPAPLHGDEKTRHSHRPFFFGQTNPNANSRPVTITVGPKQSHGLPKNLLGGLSHLHVGVKSSPGPLKLWGSKLEEILQATATLAVTEGLEQAKTKMDMLVKLYTSDVPAPRFNMREARMIAKAQEKVVLATEWVNSSELSELAGFKSANKSSGPAKWKASKKIFSINYQAEEIFPIYALDKNNGFSPLKGMKPILELLAHKKDSWGVAYWFAGANGFLDGKRPQDLIGSKPELVLEAAKDELKRVTHG